MTGVSVRKAVKFFTWFWRDRSYRTAPHIKAKFGQATLVALYYRWRRHGKSPNCFALHYAARLAPLRPKQMRRFMGACGKAGTVSLGHAAKLAGFERAIYCRIRSRLPATLVKRIKGVFKERRRAELEARADVKALQGRMRRRLAADAVRSRLVKRLAGSFIGRRERGGYPDTCSAAEGVIQPPTAIFKAVGKGVTSGS